MAEVELLLGICVIHEPSDKYVEPVTRVETNIDHSMADEDRSEGFVNPRQAGVVTIWVIAPLGDHGDCDYQVVE